MEIFDDIPFELDIEKLLSNLHVDKESEYAEEIQQLVNTVTPLMKPKAVYDVSYIQDRNEDTVTIGRVTFTSRVLRVNLDKVERVFPFIATCGSELDKVEIPADNFLAQFWLDAIKGMALGASVVYLINYLKKRYALGKTSRMSPGAATPDIWPIEQQKELFSIFGNVEDLIGVKLTDSYLMIPNKSVSGILFPTEIDFRSCQLCPREGCPGRSAPYDKNLLQEKYGKHI